MSWSEMELGWVGRSTPYSGLWALLSCGVLGPLPW
jgi:hypothetical protein